MPDAPITPENLPAVLAGVGAILSTVAGWTLWKTRKEPPAPGTVDVVQALAANTAALQLMSKAMDAQTGQFGENNKLFNHLGDLVKDLIRETQTCRDHLAVIRDALNRRPGR